MVRNIRRLGWIFGIVLASAHWAQGQDEPVPEPSSLLPVEATESPPPTVVEGVSEPEKTDFDSFGEWLDKHQEAWELDRATTLKQVDERMAAQRSSPWMTALTFGLLLLTPIALLLLGRWLMQRVGGQGDELKRQRLRMETMEESLRDLPNNLPKPTLDVNRLADRLRDELNMPAPAPVQPVVAAASTPFYQNAQWLPGAVEGPRRYLDYLYNVRETVGAVYEELSQDEDAGEGLALVSWMLSRFYHRQSQCPEANWRQLLSVAEETGYVCDLELAQRLIQSRTDEEAARTLHRALYREVLEQSISDYLILLEELRHLPNFCGAEASYATCQAVAQQIDPMVDKFLSETRRLAGYTPNHVPLFSEFTDEAAGFLRNNASERLPRVYRHLTLPRRQVLCVLAYGLRRERGWENEETQVILS
ncbi:MAG: hypothetical protein ACI8T1_005419 [Verrucomicrobiales bacterium]|jgi:hypothetical protein